LRAAEQPWSETPAAPDVDDRSGRLSSLSTTAASWTDLDKAIPISGLATIMLGSAFDCNYDSQIAIPAGTNVTIHGNGAVLDAAKKGRFFTVPSGAALALHHLVFQNGFVDNGNVSAWLRGLAYTYQKQPLTTTIHCLCPSSYLPARGIHHSLAQ
jgi:hypothetical protein